MDPDRSQLTEQESQVDDDKMLHSRIGKTEILVDKVIQNMMVFEEYTTFRHIVHREEEYVTTREDGTTALEYIDEDLYSSHSNYRSPDPSKGDQKA